MANLKEGELEITIRGGRKGLITWKGRSESREPSAVLNPYLKKEIEGLSCSELEVDFTKLNYMNSSTVPPIIQMVKNLNTKGISTKVYYDKSLRWQVASFKALETISRSLKNIDVLGK